LDTLKAMLALAYRDNLVVMVLDVKKAHLNGVVKDEDGESFVEAPSERKREGTCWKLRRWLYGMRPAARAWEDDYAEKLATEGLSRGKAAPTCFWNEATGVRALVHGDDFVVAGARSEVRHIRSKMEEWYEVKIRAVLGHGPKDDNEIIVLGRSVRWARDCVEIEADPKHAMITKKEMNIGVESKGVTAPASRDDNAEWDEVPELSKSDAKWYRGVAARANYLGLDRPDLQYAVKEACRGMARPTERDLAKVKRIARYLQTAPRLILRSGGHEGEPDEIRAYVDSDWAGCKVTRKSTSGGLLVVAGMVVKSWSSTQGSVATSSGEAEYYSLARGSAEALGLAAALKDLGWELFPRVMVDSSAANAVVTLRCASYGSRRRCGDGGWRLRRSGATSTQPTC